MQIVDGLGETPHLRPGAPPDDRRRRRPGRQCGAVPKKHPFELRYHHVEKVDWESCAHVLDKEERKRYLARGWNAK
jgi:hypothetical protein